MSGTPKRFLKRGIKHAENGDLDHAIDCLNFAIQHRYEYEPEYYGLAYRSRGTAYARKGDYNRAIADFDQAIQISPKDISAHIGRGTAYMEKSDIAHAVADFETAVRIEPHDELTRLYNTLARQLLEQARQLQG